MAAEKSGRGIGRIRLRRVKDLSADSLLPFVQGAVVPGSVVGLLFHRLAQQAVAVAPAPYHTIISAARVDKAK